MGMNTHNTAGKHGFEHIIYLDIYGLKQSQQMHIKLSICSLKQPVVRPIRMYILIHI